MAGPNPIPEIARLAALNGLYYGANVPSDPDGLAMQAVDEFLANPIAPLSAPDRELPEDTALDEYCLAMVAGARRLALFARAVEHAAAAAGRERGVTIRQLANATGIAERNASTRYRRPESEDTAQRS